MIGVLIIIAATVSSIVTAYGLMTWEVTRDRYHHPR